MDLDKEGDPRDVRFRVLFIVLELCGKWELDVHRLAVLVVEHAPGIRPGIAGQGSIVVGEVARPITPFKRSLTEGVIAFEGVFGRGTSFGVRILLTRVEGDTLVF